MISAIFRFRSAIIFLTAVALFFGIAGVGRIEIDPNNRAFFSASHSRYSDLLVLESIFGGNTELVFAVQSPVGFVDDPDLRSAITWLSGRLMEIPGVRLVDSLATYPFPMSSNEVFEVVDALDYACPAGRCDASLMEKVATSEIRRRLVSDDLRTASVVAHLSMNDTEAFDVLAVANEANTIKKEVEDRYPSLKIFLTGGVPMMFAFFSSAARDSVTLMPLAMLVIYLGLGIFLGSYKQALLLTSVGVLSVVITIGIWGWLGFELNTATATAPLVIFTLVIAGAMHLFASLGKYSREMPNLNIEDHISSCLRGQWVPIGLTAFTTAVGFCSLTSVAAPPIRELGYVAALGLVVGTLITLITVPSMFATFPGLFRSRDRTPISSALDSVDTRVLGGKWFFVSMLVAVGVSALGVFRLNVDEDFVRYFSSKVPFRVDTEAISHVLSGPYHIDVIYDSGSAEGILTAEALQNINALERYLRRHEAVVGSLSIRDGLSKVAEAIDPSLPIEQASDEMLAQYFLVYELSLRHGQTSSELISPEHRFGRISVSLEDRSMGEIRWLVEETERWANATFGPDRVVVTGEGVPTAYLSGESIREMTWSILLSLLVSASAIAFFARKVVVGLVVVIATVLPMVMGFGVWGWLGGEIGMAATLVIATTLGVVIDDTIHLLYRYLIGRQNLGLQSSEAAKYSLAQTKKALISTSLALSLGFSILMISDFSMNSIFGACTVLVIIFGLFINLWLTPHLLSRIR